MEDGKSLERKCTSPVQGFTCCFVGISPSPFLFFFLFFFVLLLEQAVWGNPVHAFRYIADIVLLIIYKT